MTFKEFVEARPEEKADLPVDLLIINDNISIETVKKMREAKVFDASKTVILADQTVPPNSIEASALWRQLMKLSDEQNIPMLAGKVRTAVYVTENVKAGQIAAGLNKEVLAAGAKGAAGISVADEDELLSVFETGTLHTTVPHRVRVCFKKADGVNCFKSAALRLASVMDDECPKGKIAVLDGDIWDLPEEGRTDGLISFIMFLAAQGVTSAVAAKGLDAEKEVYVSLRQEALAALKNSFDHIVPVNEMEPEKVNVVFIGGSTGGTFDKIERLAQAVKGKKIAYGLRLTVSPASIDVYSQIAAKGYIGDIMEAGGLVLNQCADPEIQGRVGMGETMVSNDWKNMPGYAGYEDSQTILTDTTTAIQAALTGQIGKKEEKLEEEMQENKPVIIEGRCWKFGDDIDTDIIIPTQWVCVPMEEMKHHAFEPLRPELADQLRDGDILVAGDNFGCGSSREMAAEVIKENGVRCIIAKSFARIFFRNAINNGILLIECPALPDEVKEGDVVRVELNKEITCNGKVYPIGKIHQNLYEIIADGGLVKHIENRVERGEL